MIPSSRAPKRSVPHLVAVFLVSAAALSFALLFALANDDWTVVRMPTLPWSASPSTKAFEARLFAIMLVCAAVGALIASFFWRRALVGLKRRLELESARAKAMESDLSALGRLVSSERDRQQTAQQGAAGRNGDVL